MAGSPAKKTLATVLVSFLIASALVFSACEEVEKPVQLSWGIPQEMEMFEGAVMEPEGEEVAYLEDEVLELTWHRGESYVLPFSAFSEEGVEGVRYRGSGIPEEAGLEWKDPWEVEWFPFDALPEDRIKADIREENGYLQIDFGPPGGADFEEGMTRLAWFRITPREEGDFELIVHGYVEGDENRQEEGPQVTNTIQARVSVEAP